MTRLPLRAAALLALPLLAAPLLAAPGLAETPSNRPEDGAFTSQVTFRCERGAVVPVTYVNLPGAEGFAVVQIDGQQIAMKQQTPASTTQPWSWEPVNRKSAERTTRHGK